MNSDSTGFTPQHHATLFACFADETIRRIGVAEGEKVLREGVRCYGEQRGRRMALRAQSYGDLPDMAAFLAYGEWEAPAGAMDATYTRMVPDAHMQVNRCPWHLTWQTSGTLNLGRLYCLEIDAALVRGFNPALQLEVRGTLTNGAGRCEFVFFGANLDEAARQLLVQRKEVFPGAAARLPWEYHCANLHTTLRAVLFDALGQIGAEAADAALADFCGVFGASAADAIRKYAHVDFDRLP